MPALATRYLGLDLTSPLIVAACPLSGRVDSIQRVEAAGAGAIVIRSLFEEQLQAEAVVFDEDHERDICVSSESSVYHPVLEHGGAREHLHWIEIARQAVSFPLIGSLNAVTPANWRTYARQLADAGCNALELNIYAVPVDLDRSSADIEEELLEIAGEVVNAVKVPVSVKLSPYVTGLGNLVARLTTIGVRGVVLFNRFLQPDIDPDRLQVVNEMPASGPAELRLPLRWTALLSGRVGIDLCAGTGIATGCDLAKAILAGATTVQSAGAILANGIGHIGVMLRELEDWLQRRSFPDLAAARGRLSQRQVADPFAYERAQYVRLLADVG
jgi:dihydroorotate dehydrogenase (fumarate)